MNLKITTNLHTHTCLCNHATGTVNDYCKAAIERNLTVLGISDHTPLPDNRWFEERMAIEDLPGYCQVIDQARKDFPGLKIFKAMECDYVEEFESFYRDQLLDRLNFDYLIGSIHYIPHNGEWISIFYNKLNAANLVSYTKHFIKSMESNLYAFMAHPDLFGCAYLNWDENTAACARDILEASSALNMPLEINGNGFRKSKIETDAGLRFKYPWIRFWELAAEYDIEVIANSDAHRPEDVNGNIEDAIAIANKFKLNFSKLF